MIREKAMAQYKPITIAVSPGDGPYDTVHPANQEPPALHLASQQNQAYIDHARPQIGFHIGEIGVRQNKNRQEAHVALP